MENNVMSYANRMDESREANQASHVMVDIERVGDVHQPRQGPSCGIPLGNPDQPTTHEITSDAENEAVNSPKMTEQQSRLYGNHRPRAEDGLLANELEVTSGYLLKMPGVNVFELSSASTPNQIAELLREKASQNNPPEQEQDVCLIIPGPKKFKPHQSRPPVKKAEVSNATTKFMSAISFGVISYMLCRDAQESFQDPRYKWIRYVVLGVENIALVSMLNGWYLQNTCPPVSRWLQRFGHGLCIVGVILMQAPVFQ